MEKNVKYIRKLIELEKNLLRKTNNKLINIKGTGLNAISEIYSYLNKLQKI